MGATIRKKSWWAVLPVLVLLLSLPRASSAHNPMTSWAVARLYADRMELEVEMAAESAWAFLGEPADVPPDVASKLPQLKARAAQAYRVFDGGAQLAARGAEVELKEEDGVGLVIVYPRPTAGPLRFEAGYLSKLPAGHRTTLTLKDERDVVRRTELLTAATGLVVSSTGNYTFEVFTADGDQLTPKQPDALSITVWDSTGQVWHQVGAASALFTVGGGNITNKAK